MSRHFCIKYPEYGEIASERHNVGLGGGQIGSTSAQRAFDWHLALDLHYDFADGWPWTALVQGHWNCTSNTSTTVYKMINSIGQIVVCKTFSCRFFLFMLHSSVLYSLSVDSVDRSSVSYERPQTIRPAEVMTRTTTYFSNFLQDCSQTCSKYLQPITSWLITRTHGQPWIAQVVTFAQVCNVNSCYLSFYEIK